MPVFSRIRWNRSIWRQPWRARWESLNPRPQPAGFLPKRLRNEQPRGMSSSSDPSLATSLCGIPLLNPVLAASGTFAYGVEFASLVDLNAVGGLVVKGLSREPMAGNPPPRIYETEGGMLNSIGLQNIGVRAFVAEKLPVLAQLRTAVE